MADSYLISFTKLYTWSHGKNRA